VLRLPCRGNSQEEGPDEIGFKLATLAAVPTLALGPAATPASATRTAGGQSPSQTCTSYIAPPVEGDPGGPPPSPGGPMPIPRWLHVERRPRLKPDPRRPDRPLNRCLQLSMSAAPARSRNRSSDKFSGRTGQPASSSCLSTTPLARTTCMCLVTAPTPWPFLTLETTADDRAPFRSLSTTGRLGPMVESLPARARSGRSIYRRSQPGTARSGPVRPNL